MIRYAKPHDASAVAPLLYAAIDEIAYLLTGTQDKEEAVRAMADLFALSGNRLSYENTIVAELDGRIAGFALYYDGGRMDELDRPLLERLYAAGADPNLRFPREAREDEFYLDSIAVDPAYQGRGLAKQLMAAFEEEAAKRGHNRASLIVEHGNARARRLYEAKGYEADGQLAIAGHSYDHMVKPV